VNHMRRTSLVHAKAHLSELVDEAEHKRRPVLILRHGKPAAALVPVEMVRDAGREPAPRPLRTEAELDAFWVGFGTGDASRSAVEDLRASRGGRAGGG